MALSPAATPPTASVELPARPAPAPAARPSLPFIIAPAADLVLFILSPLWALALGLLVSRIPESADRVTLFAQQVSFIGILSVTVTQSHLFLVFFRSHANRKVFREFPLRFTVVPLVFLVAQWASRWVLLAAITTAVIWDVYHSSMQVFGLGRIYDSKRGLPATHGRALDIWICHTLYVGPVLAGVNLMAHLGSFHTINDVGSHLFDFIPAYGERFHWAITEAVIVAGLLFVAYYVFWQVRAARKGLAVSWQKVLLFASTAVCSIVAWGFNSFGQAFLIMNLFHAVQYFALVWWVERGTIQRTFRLEQAPGGAYLSFALFCALGLGYGFWVGWGYKYWPSSPVVSDALLAVVNTVAIMHFWYDGFVWSVRKKAMPA